MPRLLYTVLLCLLIKNAAAQKPSYPQGYFRNPLGIPILLAGNFGECRSGHFHSGLDIKTGGHENEPVYAAADGYISRIKLEPGGFGHGLYITHPNGYTTLYAHLNDFRLAIQQYLRRQQYTKESWTVDLQFGPEQFPVKKGEQIAWSGNTGGSTAPHLHFEIRDTKTEHPLNGQLFGFDVKDTQAPVPAQVVVYNRSNVDLFPLKINARIYKPKDDTLRINDEITSIGIVADDFMEGSDNTLAFYTAEWYADDSLQGRIRLDDIGYEETGYINAYADYGIKQTGGPWVQRLYRLPNNQLTHIYEAMNRNAGLLPASLSNNKPHAIRIILTDVYGNSSETRFWLRAKPNLSLRDFGGSTRLFSAKQFNRVETPAYTFYLDETSLYDDTHIGFYIRADSAAISSRYTIGNPSIPVHHSFDLQIKPDKLIPFALRNKVVMVYSDGKKESGKAAIPTAQGLYRASVRELGVYRLVIDTTMPVIKPFTLIKNDLSKAKSIAFRATDNYTSVKTFRGELDRKWLLFEQHGDIWTYIFDEHCPKGKHTLVIKAMDENGNEARASYIFTR